MKSKIKRMLCRHEWRKFEYTRALKNGKTQYLLVCDKCGNSKVTCRLPKALKDTV